MSPWRVGGYSLYHSKQTPAWRTYYIEYSHISEQPCPGISGEKTFNMIYIIHFFNTVHIFMISLNPNDKFELSIVYFFSFPKNLRARQINNYEMFKKSFFSHVI